MSDPEESKGAPVVGPDGLVMLSDELNEDSEGEPAERVSREKPGNAQFLETPRV